MLDGLLENDRVLVQGGAGSGKTLIAAEAARRWRGEPVGYGPHRCRGLG
ncbi:MAG: hypothetical protein WCK73_02735 [Deltaproteobacteria bacterium]